MEIVKMALIKKKQEFFPLLFIIGLVIWLYFRVFIYLFNMWSTDEYSSHGFLVPLIALFFVWQKREKLKLIAPQSSGIGLMVLCFGLFVYLFAIFAEVDFVKAISFILVLWGLVLYFLGTKYFRQLLFPLCFLFFMVPMPEMFISVVSFPMQLLSSTYAAMFTGILGIPVQRDGVNLYVRNFSFEVAAPCSGLKSTVALLVLATVVIYLIEAAPWKKSVLFVAAFPIALGANIFRIICVLLLGHFFNPKVALGFFHGFSGIVLFMVAFFGLLSVGRLLGCRKPGRIIG